ncbi:MAG: FAD-binding oxidoreductase [Clostridiales Family XIII bacterium]|jgi:D-lactate dehydrogenase (cytochrome)|nr:FAD-binding oxidoreductase [Clostridiales Family XIII bacterium]
MRINDLIKPISDIYEDYLHDESHVVGTADSISFPRSEAELAEILAAESLRGRRITIQGGRTGISAAAVPHCGHIINMSRMDRITGMRMDGTCTCIGGSAGMHMDGSADMRTEASVRFHIRLQPGVTLAQLNSCLSQKCFDTSGWDTDSLTVYAAFCTAPEQFFAPDPTEASAAFGGMAACGASGARTYRYGSVREHISALRIMLRDGRTLNLRRGENFAHQRLLKMRTDDGSDIELTLPSYNMPKVKNAAGYYIADGMDAIDLFIGSDGTLGIICEMEIAILKRPPNICYSMCFFSDEPERTSEEKALAFVSRVRADMDCIAAIEYFDARSLEILRSKAAAGALADMPALPEDYHAAVCLELHNECSEDETAQLLNAGDCMESAGGDPEDVWIASTPSAETRLKLLRHTIPESVNEIIGLRKKTDASISKIASDMAAPDGYLTALMYMYRSSLAASGLDCAVWGHIGDNHLHVNILPRNADEFTEGKRLLKEWAEKVRSMGGTVSAEHGIGRLKTEYLTIMYGEKHIREMSAMKRVFDPDGSLGAGVMFAASDPEILQTADGGA